MNRPQFAGPEQPPPQAASCPACGKPAPRFPRDGSVLTIAGIRGRILPSDVHAACAPRWLERECATTGAAS